MFPNQRPSFPPRPAAPANAPAAKKKPAKKKKADTQRAALQNIYPAQKGGGAMGC